MSRYQEQKIPAQIVTVTVVDLLSGEKEILTKKAGSACHFFGSFPAGRYEIVLRLDWSDPREYGPCLDADFYPPGGAMKKAMKSHPSHHTEKLPNGNGQFVYDFEYESVQKQLYVEYTSQIIQTGCASIVKPSALH